MLNKNNVKVKLADGLTEMGISQVKAEVGSGGQGGESEYITLYCTSINDGENKYLVDPVNFEPYIGIVDPFQPLSPTEEEINEVLDKIEQDYGITVLDIFGNKALFSNDKMMKFVYVKDVRSYQIPGVDFVKQDLPDVYNNDSFFGAMKSNFIEIADYVPASAFENCLELDVYAVGSAEVSTASVFVYIYTKEQAE